VFVSQPLFVSLRVLDNELDVGESGVPLGGARSSRVPPGSLTDLVGATCLMTISSPSNPLFVRVVLDILQELQEVLGGLLG